MLGQMCHCLLQLRELGFTVPLGTLVGQSQLNSRQGRNSAWGAVLLLLAESQFQLKL